jgi:hypothetical protein
MQIQVIAQDNEGTVTGTVVSQNGDILAGVTVIATNVNSRAETYSAATNEKGIFALRTLKIGSVYRL